MSDLEVVHLFYRILPRIRKIYNLGWGEAISANTLMDFTRAVLAKPTILDEFND